MTSNDILASLSAHIRHANGVDTARARRMLTCGVPFKEIAEFFGVSETDLAKTLNLFGE